MLISPISNKIDGCYTTQLSFGNRITRAMQSKSVFNDVMLDRFLAERDEIIGKLPKEFFELLKKNNRLNLSNKEFVSQIREIFIRVSGICREYEKFKIANTKDMEKVSTNELFIDFKSSVDEFCGEKRSMKRIQLRERLAKRKAEKQVEKELKRGFAKLGLISSKDKVKADYLKEGRFGYPLRISMLDEHGNRIISDKVLKFFKDENWNKKDFASKKLASYRLIHEKSEEMLNYLKSKSKLDATYREQTERFILEVKKVVLVDDFVQKLVKKHFQMNGFTRETNMALFIEKNMGHNLDTEMTKFHFSDRKGNYMLSDFVPQDNQIKETNPVGTINKKLDNFLSLGWAYGDANPANFINFKIIDFGGFNRTNPVLAKVDVARKYYKKIINVNIKDKDRKIQEQIRRLNYYYNLAAKNKLPNAKEVILGLKEAKKNIPKSKHSELIF